MKINKPLKSIIHSSALLYTIENSKQHSNITDAMMDAYTEGFTKAWEMASKSVEKAVDEHFNIKK